MTNYIPFIKSLQEPKVIVYDYYIKLNDYENVLHIVIDEYFQDLKLEFNRKIDEFIGSISTNILENNENKILDSISTELFIALNYIEIKSSKKVSSRSNLKFNSDIYLHHNLNKKYLLEDFKEVSWTNENIISNIIELIHKGLTRVKIFIEEKKNIIPSKKVKLVETFEELIPDKNHQDYILTFLKEKELISENKQWQGNKEKLASFLRHYLKFKDYYISGESITDNALLMVAENSFKKKMSPRTLRNGSEIREKYKELDSLKSSKEIAKTATAK